MCVHSATTLTQEDEIVCEECGLVLDKNYSVVPYQFPIDEYKDFAMREKVLDVCYNAHIPIVLVDPTLQFYDSIRQDVKLKKFSCQTLLAFALYKSLINEKISRPPAEICGFFGITAKHFNSIDQLLNENSFTTSGEIMERYAVELNIPWKYHQEIRNFIEKLEDISCARPETVIGCAFMLAHEKFFFEDRLTFSKVSMTCGISISAIKSLRKKYLEQEENEKREERKKGEKEEKGQKKEKEDIHRHLQGGLNKYEKCVAMLFSSL